jgi:hypothetical protein
METHIFPGKKVTPIIISISKSKIISSQSLENIFISLSALNFGAGKKLKQISL